jgi:putative ABC transport system permease protein
MNISAEKDEGPKVAGFLDQLQERVGGLPGVRSFAFSNGFPYLGANQLPFSVEGREPFNPKIDQPALLYVTSPRYFETLGIQLTKGRVFAPEDRRGRPLVVIIDQAFARASFPQEDPIGKHLKLAVPDLEKLGFLEIVGVVKHVNTFGMKEEKAPKPQFYVSFNQVPEELLPTRARRLNLVVRTTNNPASLAPAIRREILSIDKDQPVYDVRTMEQIAASSTAPQRFSMILLSIFSAVSLLLSTVGIYSVMSYSVKQRTQEIGIRMALGARRSDIIKLFMRSGLRLTLLGLVIGLAASMALTRILSSLLYEVSPTDPLTFAGTSLVLACVALLACFLPAQRATKVEPVEALRYE